ncbi:MAG: hypothetical protein JSR39_02495 [Verrucomicrobia bacterium]|nr:hypothetical protein [Verrucomicrobiota bacterium]
MHYTRIYSDLHGDSRFEDVEISLSDKGLVGKLSEIHPAKCVQFRENKADYHWDFHTAPDRQFVILLDGEIEITTSLGEVRNFKGGDILLVEDVSGKGHKTRNIKQQLRRSIFIKL